MNTAFQIRARIFVALAAAAFGSYTIAAQTGPAISPKAATARPNFAAPAAATPAPTPAVAGDAGMADQQVPQPAPPAPPRRAARGPFARLNAVRNGVLTVRNAERLHVETETGNVAIHIGAPGAVRYQVQIQADSREPDAQRVADDFQVQAVQRPTLVMLTGRSMEFRRRARLWVSYDVTVPSAMRIEVITHAGNIRVDGTASNISLDTDGGDISVGRVTGPARLVTKGGHIIAGDIGGDLHAETLGGHITVANVGGDAVLTTGGGHIHAGRISGTAQLDTGGGNVYVESAGSRVTASSAGGMISFGEAAGAIQAHTSGGGIRVLRVAGPMQLDSNGGSILLTQVDNQVHASTGTGSITAWLVPNAKFQSTSELQSGQGDILVYVPRNVALTIDATVESPGDHRIEADSTLPLKVKYVKTAAGKTLHGECAINGGGEVLHLKTISGNIRLRSADAMLARQQALIDQQYRQQMVIFQQQLRRLTEEDPDQIRQQMEQMIGQLKLAQDMARATTLRQWTAQMPTGQARALAPQASTPAAATGQVTAPATPETWPSSTPQAPEPGTADVWWIKLNEIWYGGVRVDYDEQQRRIVRPVAQPAYPEVAREAGIEGTVEMRVTIDEQGRVSDIRLLSGEPVLVQAAMEAVRQWRYRPYLVDHKPVKVVTVVRLEFKLQ